jgi:glycyl-tRNA synthetase beta chain
MVGEFPELQGLMGGYYATAQGKTGSISAAIRDHYKPVGVADSVPSEPDSVAVALADKLDALVGFFKVNEKPTGSKDPFALRRAALAVIRLLTENNIRLPLLEKFVASAQLYSNNGVEGADPSKDLLDFFADRLKVQQKEAGVRHDLIDAVFALGGEDDLVRLLARVKALQAFVTTEDGTNLLAGYKRAANILKQSPVTPAEAGVSVAEMPASAGMTDLSPAESSLQAALDTAEPKAAEAIQGEQFGDAMAALASLRGPIDTFFDGVMVNDPDPQKRAFRLGLLARFRDAVHRVADFSKIEG